MLTTKGLKWGQNRDSSQPSRPAPAAQAGQDEAGAPLYAPKPAAAPADPAGQGQAPKPQARAETTPARLPGPGPRFIAVSFYTDEAYRAEAEKLKASLDALGIAHDIRALASRGSWIANVEMKPEFIKAMLMEHPGTPIVWIDADGIVRRYPVIFDALDGYDLAVHFLHWANGKDELLGGTMWLENNTTIMGLMDEWIAESKALQKFKDQLSLQNIIKRNPGRFRVYRLPANYTQIFDIMKGAGQPVIEHFQASRRFRRTAR